MQTAPVSNTAHSPEYVDALREAVENFGAAWGDLLALHVDTTTSMFGPRGIMPALVLRDGVSEKDVAAAKSKVARAAGAASHAVPLTGVYVSVQGVGNVDPIANWETPTRPKPVLEATDVSSSVDTILGRLDALTLNAQHSKKEADEPVSSDGTTAGRRPRVFVGSSAEGLKPAQAVQVLFDHNCETELWTQGVFDPGGSTLESLVEAAPTYDFAVLIVTPDDTTMMRGRERSATRDNVIFELGLFIGRLGRKRVFMVYDRDNKPDLPSDLAGVTAVTYVQNSGGNWQAALGAAATLMGDTIDKLGLVE